MSVIESIQHELDAVRQAIQRLQGREAGLSRLLDSARHLGALDPNDVAFGASIPPAGPAAPTAPQSVPEVDPALLSLRDRILRIFESVHAINTRDIASRLELPKSRIQQELDTLANEGIVTSAGIGRHPRYSLVEKTVEEPVGTPAPPRAPVKPSPIVASIAANTPKLGPLVDRGMEQKTQLRSVPLKPTTIIDHTGKARPRPEEKVVRPPARRRSGTTVREHVAVTLHDEMNGKGWFKFQDVVAVLPGTTENGLRAHIKSLVADGRLEARGKTVAREYRIPKAEADSRTGQSGPSDEPSTSRGGLDLRGAVMEALQDSRFSVTDLATLLEAQPDEVAEIVAKLTAAGHARTADDGTVELTPIALAAVAA